MTNKDLLLLSITVTLFSCSPAKKSASNSPNGQTIEKSIPIPSDDGLSYATAIVITETSETKGVHSEYEWIKEHYSNYTIKGQSLMFKDKKPFDVITIILSDSKEQACYFDISNFYGKF